MKISSVVLVAVLAFSFAAVTIHARSAPGATDSADKVGDPVELKRGLKSSSECRGDGVHAIGF